MNSTFSAHSKVLQSHDGKQVIVCDTSEHSKKSFIRQADEKSKTFYPEFVNNVMFSFINQNADGNAEQFYYVFREINFDENRNKFMQYYPTETSESGSASTKDKFDFTDIFNGIFMSNVLHEKKIEHVHLIMSNKTAKKINVPMDFKTALELLKTSNIHVSIYFVGAEFQTHFKLYKTMYDVLKENCTLFVNDTKIEHFDISKNNYIKPDLNRHIRENKDNYKEKLYYTIFTFFHYDNRVKLYVTRRFREESESYSKNGKRINYMTSDFKRMRRSLVL